MNNGKVVWSRRAERYSTNEYQNELATVHAERSEPVLGGVSLREHFAERRWPVVTLRVALPVNRLDLRDELTAKLRAVIEDFLHEHKLFGDE